MITEIKDGIEWFAAVVGAVMVIASFFAEGRKTLRAAGRGVWWLLGVITVPVRAPWMVPKMLSMVESMRAELDFNGGGSVKDVVTMDHGVRMHDFRLQPRPGFICDEKGAFSEVTDAMIRLVKETDRSRLLGQNWRNYIYNEDIAKVVDALLGQAASGADFRWRCRWTDGEEARGMWEMILTAVLRKADGRVRYVGTLRPVDEIAKGIAQRNGWHA